MQLVIVMYWDLTAKSAKILDNVTAKFTLKESHVIIVKIHTLVFPIANLANVMKRVLMDKIAMFTVSVLA